MGSADASVALQRTEPACVSRQPRVSQSGRSVECRCRSFLSRGTCTPVANENSHLAVSNANGNSTWSRLGSSSSAFKLYILSQKMNNPSTCRLTSNSLCAPLWASLLNVQSPAMVLLRAHEHVAVENNRETKVKRSSRTTIPRLPLS